MTTQTQKSFWLTKEAGEAQREWYVVDLKGQVLGRAATKIASVLRGKHKPTYSPNVDMGDFVVVINAGGVELTGGKPDKKVYYKHTLFPGGPPSGTAPGEAIHSLTPAHQHVPSAGPTQTER